MELADLFLQDVDSLGVDVLHLGGLTGLVGQLVSESGRYFVLDALDVLDRLDLEGVLLFASLLQLLLHGLQVLVFLPFQVAVLGLEAKLIFFHLRDVLLKLLYLLLEVLVGTRIGLDLGGVLRVVLLDVPLHLDEAGLILLQDTLLVGCL